MRWVTTLALVLGLSGLTTNSRADDPMLRAVDQLASTGQCEAALVLLDHINRTEPAFYGRRALCEAALGRSEEAAAHGEAALQAPDDEWVMANRAALQRTARATTPTTEEAAPTTTLATPVPAEDPSAMIPLLGNPYRTTTTEAMASAEHTRTMRVTMTQNPYRFGARDESPAEGEPLTEAQILANPYTLSQRIEGANGLASNPYYYDR